MPAPTTNKTSHFNASDNDHIWTAWQGTTPFHNGVPVNGDGIHVVDDEDARDLSLISTTSHWAFYNSTTPVMALPNLKWIFTNAGANTPPWQYKLYTHAATLQPLSALIGTTPSAWMVTAAFRLYGGATNDSNVLNNEGLIVDEVGWWGVYVKTSGSVVTLVFYSHDGTISGQVAIGSLAFNTDYVFVYWRTGTSIFAEVYNAGGLAGSGSMVVGNTGGVTGNVIVGGNPATTAFPSMYLGEIVTYNAYVSGDKSALVTYMQGKWLGGGGGGPPPPTFTSFSPNSAYVNPTVPVKLVGVAIAGTGLDGTGGAFSTVSGFTFSNLVIAGGGASGTVDIQIAAAKATGAYTFTYSTSGGSSSGTSTPAVTFTISTPSGGTSGDTGGATRFNAGLN